MYVPSAFSSNRPCVPVTLCAHTLLCSRNRAERPSPSRPAMPLRLRTRHRAGGRGRPGSGYSIQRRLVHFCPSDCPATSATLARLIVSVVVDRLPSPSGSCRRTRRFRSSLRCCSPSTGRCSRRRHSDASALVQPGNVRVDARRHRTSVVKSPPTPFELTLTSLLAVLSAPATSPARHPGRRNRYSPPSATLPRPHVLLGKCRR